MQVPVGLQTHPELWRRLEETGEPERGISRNTSLPNTISFIRLTGTLPVLPSNRAVSGVP
jgi:hypothetical protein